MATPPIEALDLPAAADALGVHYQTAYRWVRSGRLPAVRVDGRYVVERTAIDGVSEERAAVEALPAPSRSRLDRSAERMHELLVDGDEPGARRLVGRLFDEGAPVVEVMQAVLVPPLARIGADWHEGELSIWIEHRATAIVERLLGELVRNPRGRRRGTAVVAAVSGDRHSLPTTMAAVTLRDDHWHVHHLGADVPVAEIVRCCEAAIADLAVITATNPATHGDARLAVEEVASTGVHTLLGGPGRSLTELVEHASCGQIAAGAPVVTASMVRGLAHAASSAVGEVQDRVVAATTGLFSHGPQPLVDTLSYAPDPGLLGPESVSWRVIGDATAFVGGIRALLVQTAHPEVVAGVEQHSRYRDDPLGRLTRTSLYVTETTYGAMPEVESAVATVRRAHRPVRGRSERDRAYSAGHPAMAAWVHNVLTDSFLAAYQAFGPGRLTTDEADRFVAEQTRIGALLDADPLPTTAAELAAWIDEHPDVAPTASQASAIDFLGDPPLSPPVKVGYKLLLNAAASTLSPRIAEVIGVESPRCGDRVGRAAVGSLRWALGSSPSWHLALVRSGGEIPDGIFRQPLPPEAEELLRRRSAQQPSAAS